MKSAKRPSHYDFKIKLSERYSNNTSYSHSSIMNVPECERDVDTRITNPMFRTPDGYSREDFGNGELIHEIESEAQAQYRYDCYQLVLRTIDELETQLEVMKTESEQNMVKQALARIEPLYNFINAKTMA